jgi:hypothetical protein
MMKQVMSSLLYVSFLSDLSLSHLAIKEELIIDATGIGINNVTPERVLEPRQGTDSY